MALRATDNMCTEFQLSIIKNVVNVYYIVGVAIWISGNALAWVNEVALPV